MSDREQDWELTEDYYCGREGKKELSLEDFIMEDDGENKDPGIFKPADEKLKKTIEDVHQVMALAGEGKNISEIAAATGLDETYIYDIQVCAQGFREDDEIAVAHLVLG